VPSGLSWISVFWIFFVANCGAEAHGRRVHQGGLIFGLILSLERAKLAAKLKESGGGRI
jgi:hypothetical protein